MWAEYVPVAASTSQLERNLRRASQYVWRGQAAVLFLPTRTYPMAGDVDFLQRYARNGRLERAGGLLLGPGKAPSRVEDASRPPSRARRDLSRNGGRSGGQWMIPFRLRGTYSSLPGVMTRGSSARGSQKNAVDAPTYPDRPEPRPSPSLPSLPFPPVSSAVEAECWGSPRHAPRARRLNQPARLGLLSTGPPASNRMGTPTPTPCPLHPWPGTQPSINFRGSNVSTPRFLLMTGC